MLHDGGSPQVAGESYTLTCQVTGGGTVLPLYQWFKNSSLLTSETSDTLSLSPLRETGSGIYTCAGTRSFVTVTSANITVAVAGKFEWPIWSSSILILP